MRRLKKIFLVINFRSRLKIETPLKEIAKNIIHTIGLYLFLSKLGLISLNASITNTTIDRTVNTLVPIVNISLCNSLCLTAVSGLVSFFFKPISIK